MYSNYFRNLLITITLLLSVASVSAATDKAIQLDCAQLSGSLIEQLGKEYLLADDKKTQERAQSIAFDWCNRAESTAQQQHELNKKAAMDNWFLEYRADKDGNRRLKNRR